MDKAPVDEKLELISYAQLKPEFGIQDSRDTIDRKMRKEPPEFPRCVATSKGRIAWYKHEVRAHVANLKRCGAVNFRAKKKQMSKRP